MPPSLWTGVIVSMKAAICHEEATLVCYNSPTMHGQFLLYAQANRYWNPIKSASITFQ